MGKKNRWENRIICFMLLLCLLAASSDIRSMAAGKDATDARNISPGQEIGFILTPEEEEYLEKIKSRTIIFGIAEASAYTEKDGTAYGTFVPVLHVLEDIFGLDVDIVPSNWADSWDRLLDGEFDFLYGIPVGQEKETLVDGTPIYPTEWLYTNPAYLVARSEEASRNKGADMRLGLLEGFRQTEQIAPYLHSTELVRYTTPEEMLQGLYRGQVDALVVAESFRENLFGEGGLEVVGDLSYFASYTAFATAKEEYLELIELFDRYLEENIPSHSVENRKNGESGRSGENRENKESKEINESKEIKENKENTGLRNEIQSEKQAFLKHYIMETEASAIRAAKEEYETIRYAFSSPNSIPLSYQRNKEKIGIFEDLLQFIEENTGLSFEEEKSLSGADAAAALDENDIQLLVGELKSDRQFAPDGLFTPLADTCLVPVVSAAEPFEKEQIGYCYWGVEENYMPLLEGTIFDGRSISYENKAALLQAYQNGEVGGMLQKRGSFDYNRFIVGEENQKTVEDISIPASEGIAYNGSNEQLNALLKKLITIYRLVKWKYSEELEKKEKTYYSTILVEHAQQKKELLIWKVAAVGLAGLFLLSLFGRNGEKKKNKKKKQKKDWKTKKGNSQEEFWEQMERQTAAHPYPYTRTAAMRPYTKAKTKMAEPLTGTLSKSSRNAIATAKSKETAERIKTAEQKETAKRIKTAEQKETAKRIKTAEQKETAERIKTIEQKETPEQKRTVERKETTEQKEAAKSKETIPRRLEKNAVTEEIDSIISSVMNTSPVQEDKKAQEGSTQEEAIVENSMARENNNADALTGLIGEHTACKKINEILEQYPQAQAVFSYLDLKKLKQVNHTYSYKTGDEVLVSFAKSLKTLELDQNTVVFRVDGDKFGAFRGNLQSELDYQLYLGELQSLSAQARANGKLVYVSYCCSAAVYKKDAENLKDLIKYADKALQFAKKEGLPFAAWEEKKGQKKQRKFLKHKEHRRDNA